MQCTFCSAENANRGRFCTECGRPLCRRCPNCQTENPASAKFCGQCATGLDPRDAANPHSAAASPSSAGVTIGLNLPVPEWILGGERKTVTVLFADIKGSVELMSELDAEEALAILDPALRAMVDSVRAHEGHVVRTTGDGICALFGAPTSYEDHPRRAIRAGLAIQAALRSFAEKLAAQGKPPVQVRVGINTGEVIVRAIDTGGRLEYNAVGHAINLASRLEAAAPPGSIAIGLETKRLVESYFEVQPLPPKAYKGVRDPVAAYEVTGLGASRRHLQVALRRGLSPFVGRAGEMLILQDSLQAVSAGRGSIVATVTEAGTGKSRLLHEFLQTVPASWRILDAYAVSYGKRIPWMLAIEILRRYFDVGPGQDAAAQRTKIEDLLATLDPETLVSKSYLFELLGISEAPGSLAQMDLAVRRVRVVDAITRVLLAASRETPLVLVFEDLHWADEPSRLLLADLAGRIARSRILLLLTYRPGYDVLSNGQGNCTEIRLEPLTAGSAAELLESLLPGANHLAGLKRFLIERTAGNPFFLEEIVRSMFEDGTLVRDDTLQLTKPLDQLRLPQTVQDTLAERIDMLPAAHKDVLQRLAVIGARPPADLVRGVCDLFEPGLDGILADLTSGEFVHPEHGAIPTVYAFRHALTQEVAYGTMITERRQRLHERVAETIEGLYAEQADEYVNQLAHHYVRTQNVPKAVHYLGRAGDYAVQRSANVEAAESLRAAIRLAKSLPESPERLAQESRFWLALGVSLQSSLGYAADDVGAAYAQARQLSERTGDVLQLVSAIRGHSIFSIVRADYETAFELGRRLSQVRDEAGTYNAERLVILGLSSLYTGALEAGERYFLQALDAKETTGQFDTIQYSGHSRALCLSYMSRNVWYLGHPARALQHSTEGVQLGERLGIPITIAQAKAMYGLLAQTRRDFDVAEQYMEETVQYADKHGFPYWLTLCSMMQGWLVTRRTGSGAGMAQFDEHLGRYRASGARLGLPWFLSLRAEMLANLGDIDAALRSLDEGLAITEKTNERVREAELHRLRGELLLMRDGLAAGHSARSCFRRGLTIARRQAARSLELRAATSLARLDAREHRLRQALDAIGSILPSFRDEPDTPDLRDGRALYDELARATSAEAFDPGVAEEEHGHEQESDVAASS